MHFWPQLRRNLVGLVISLSLSSAGCVTTHTGEPVTAAGTNIKVSCVERTSIAKDFFRYVTCTLENDGDDFADLGVASVAPKNVDGVKVSTAAEIKSFEEAFAFERVKDNYNAAVIAGSLVGAGLAIAILGGKTGSLVGPPLMIGASSSELGRDWVDEVDVARNGDYRFSANHLLGPNFSLPPRSFVRRGILLQAKQENFHVACLNVCLSSPSPGCFDVPVQNWQARWGGSCAVPDITATPLTAPHHAKRSDG